MASQTKIPDFYCGLRFPVQFEVLLIEVESLLGLRNFVEVDLIIKHQAKRS